MIDLSQDVYTIREVAQTVGVTYQTANKWAKNGRLGHYQCGRTRKVSRADLQGFLAQAYKPADTLTP
jgi:excisionase family DNA binding protein